MGNFYLHPIGGLANRLRSIVGCRVLSKYLGFNFYITWIENEKYPGFDNAFKSTNGFNIINKSLIPENVIDFNPVGRQFDINQLKSYENISMTSYGIPKPILESYNEWDKLYQQTYHELELLNDIKERIPELPKECIGVHIRRTDHLDSIERSLTEYFVDIITRYHDKTIFLSTDNKNVENLIINTFGDRIIVNKKLGYDKDNPTDIIQWGYGDFRELSFKHSKEQLKLALVESVIDFHTLSKTSKIYGCVVSSFSEEAAKINNIPLIVVKR
jgi:hypothetical protein